MVNIKNIKTLKLTDNIHDDEHFERVHFISANIYEMNAYKRKINMNVFITSSKAQHVVALATRQVATCTNVREYIFKIKQS